MRTKRTTMRTLMTAVLLSGVVALGVQGTRAVSGHAFASEIQREAGASYRAAGSWRARIEQRELVGKGVYRTTRSRIIVAGPARYRVDLWESTGSGGETASTTLRDGDTLYTVTTTGDGETRVHVLENVPPDLGFVMDNPLGERVQDVVRARGVRLLGREAVRGRGAAKLGLDRDQVVWIDDETSLPVKEQHLSDGVVVSETEILEFESETSIPAGELDPGTLQEGTRTVEDLGFSECDPPEAFETLGFRPLGPADAGPLTRGIAGVDTGSLAADGAGRPSWVEQYEGPHGCVLITQTLAMKPVADDLPDVTDIPETAATTQVNGRPVSYYDDGWKTVVFFQEADISVCVEGTLGIDELLAFAASLR